MAGWLKRVDGSGLESFKTDQSFQKTDNCLDLEPVSEAPVKAEEEEQHRNDNDKLHSSFDEILFVFLQKTFGTTCFRPLPPLLGDGKPVDLFKLYLDVRKRGGSERVSEKNLWPSVARVCGLDSSAGLALKLIYVKYLHVFSRTLKRAVKDKDSKGGVKDSFWDPFSLRLMELESDLGRFIISDKEKNDGGYTNMGMHKTHLSDTGEHLHAEVQLLDENSESLDSRGSKSFKKTRNDNFEYSTVASHAIGKSVICGDIGSDLNLVEDDGCSKKRRRDLFTGMLKWMSSVAKDPCDPAIGQLPESSMWKCYPSDQPWKRVLMVREAMLLKRNVDSSDQFASGQKKQKMHPFMYDDHSSCERLRFSQRLSAKDSLKKSSSGTDEDRVDELSDSTADSIPYFLVRQHRGSRVPLGPDYQADVPEWTGETYESDTKWLGTMVWPPEKGEHNKNSIERVCTGKGRQDSCGCQYPGSHECVKFHICEERMRLKLEIGTAFYHWGFIRMGEEVAYSWTKQEEKEFHRIVKSNPSNRGKYFWDELVKSFPGKSMQSLVSYYFNVFLLQQRGQQNRATPNELNSDEEDSGFGAEVANSGSIFCSPKRTQPSFR